MKRILVTGINGFVGHHVARALNDKNIKVVGASREQELQSDLTDMVSEYIVCDLVDPDDVKKIDLSSIDAIINLAGFAKVGESRGQGELYNKVNIGVHTVLYDECLRQGVSPRIIAVSTGAVYDPSQPLPITEESKLIDQEKTNEYTVSKQLMEKSLQQYRDKGLRVIVARPFNHSGPGQLPGFLIPDLGVQIANAASRNEPLMVGNLKTKRDYTDVRDVAQAYVLLASSPEGSLNHDLYNICSGSSTEGNELLADLLEAFDAKEVKIEVDPSRLRPTDVMDIYGSHERLTNDTGWEPQITTKKMVRDYANYVNLN